MDKKRGKSAFFNDDEFEIEETVTEPVVDTEEPIYENPPETESVQSTPAPAPAKLLADMIEQKPEGKTCGFYLSSEAIKKLDKAAKQLKCSKSKALDLLIRKYL